MATKARHQSDHLDERRSALARRRHAGRDVPRRNEGGRASPAPRWAGNSRRPPPRSRPLLDRHGLVLVSGWYDGRIHEKELAAEWDAILPHLTLLNECGCRHVVYADTSGRSEGDLFAPISQRPNLADGDWTAYGKRLTALAEKMADFGVGMAFHHHMGTIVETDAEVDRLMAPRPARQSASSSTAATRSFRAATRSRCCSAISPASCTSIARTRGRTS